jgi:hypothetical protein
MCFRFAAAPKPPKTPARSIDHAPLKPRKPVAPKSKPAVTPKPILTAKPAAKAAVKVVAPPKAPAKKVILVKGKPAAAAVPKNRLAINLVPKAFSSNDIFRNKPTAPMCEWKGEHGKCAVSRRYILSVPAEPDTWISK